MDQFVKKAATRPKTRSDQTATTKVRKILAQIFTEPGPPPSKPSFSRIFTGIWLFACVTWISTYLSVAHKLPEGPTLFGMAAIGGFLYPANKIGNAIGGPGKADDPAI